MNQPAPSFSLQRRLLLTLLGSIALVWGAMLLLGGFGVRRLHKQVSA